MLRMARLLRQSTLATPPTIASFAKPFGGYLNTGDPVKVIPSTRARRYPISIMLTPPRMPHPRWWSLLVMGLCLGYAITTLTRLSPWWLPLIAAAWVGLGALLRWGAPLSFQPPAAGRKLWPWSLLPLALWGLYVYLADSFGIVDVGAVYFHLQAGMTDHGGVSRIGAAVLYCLSMLALLIAVVWLVRHDHRWRRAEPLLAIALLASNPLLYGITQRGAAIVTDDGAWLERQYVEPMLLESPESPPNLLLLYLESIERTYADRERFGDAYADLDVIGERGLVYEGVRQINNTGWTMAGMIASQCGTPLMPAGLLHDRQFTPLDKVVPGVDCLGDLLAKAGYRLSYLGGASTAFAGKGIFYEDHGFETVLGARSFSPGWRIRTTSTIGASMTIPSTTSPSRRSAAWSRAMAPGGGQPDHRRPRSQRLPGTGLHRSPGRVRRRRYSLLGGVFGMAGPGSDRASGARGPAGQYPGGDRQRPPDHAGLGLGRADPGRSRQHLHAAGAGRSR